MTVSYEDVAVSNNASGSDSSFAIGNITFTDNADIDVYIRDVGESPPTEVLKTLTTHYYLTDSAGNQTNPATHVKFDTSAGHTLPASDQKVVIKRKILATQSTDYAAGDAFPADSHEAALDKLTLLIQQMQEQINRTWLFPETYLRDTPYQMPEPGNNAVIRWNSDGTALISDLSLATAAYKVSPSADDSTADYLEEKLKPGTGLSATTANPGGDEEYTFSIDATVATLTGTQTLTNKRLNSPKLNEDVAITTTATELNILDGDTGASTVTLADADRLIVNDGGTMKQVALTAFETYFESVLDTLSVTSVGALDSGSITSNFGNIDTGSSTITTTGLISGGSLDIDNVLIDGTTIGHTDDTDLMTLADASLTVKGTVTVGVDDTGHDVKFYGATAGAHLLWDESDNSLETAGDATINVVKDKLLIGGTAVTTTAAELNLLDGVSGLVQADFTKLAAIDASAAEINLLDDVSGLVQADFTKLAAVDSTADELNLLDGSAKSTSSITIADDDAFIVIDGTTTKQIPASDLETYMESSLDTLSNVTTVGALNAGSITSGFGAIDNGSSNITTTGTISGGTVTATTNIELDHQGSDPAAPGVANDVVLYAKEKKVYTRDGDGTITELGAGGGVGSIDTLFTIQAKSADAAYTAIGNGYVWSGAGSSLTNATLALETTALDLIQSEKVFAYDSGGSGIRNWWYHEQEIQNGYGGKNMVLQLQYFTRNCADSNIFRFYARDAAKPIFTSDGSADAGTNQILGAASWDASLSTSSPDDRKAAEVGDRIVIIDTSNNIHYRYITAVSGAVVTPGALTITYSGSDIAPANSTVMLIGVMTDELDYLPANNMAAAGNNEAKLYKKQMSFPEGCRLFQFGFHVESTDVDVELYYDDIALSANQFLQVSSQGQTEEYMSTGWGGRIQYRLYGGTERINTLNELGSVSVGDSSNGWRYTSTAKQKVNMTVTAGLSGGNSYLAILKGTIAQVGTNTTSGTDSSYENYRMAIAEIKDGDIDEISASFVVEKDEIIEVATSNNAQNPHTGATNASVHFTATPLVNDVVLLNSQDEIFTDWVDAGAMTVTQTSSTGDKPSSIDLDRVQWRRDGSDMILRWSFYASNKSGGTSGTGDYLFHLPSGYSMDSGKVNYYTTNEGYGDFTTAGASSLGFAHVQDNSGGAHFTGQCFAYDDTKFRIAGLLTTHATVTRHTFIGSDNGYTWANMNVYSCNVRIPIAGWTSTFNPVLSMPLVDLGQPLETWIVPFTSSNNFWAGSGDQRQWDKALLKPYPNGAANTISTSNLVTVSDISSGGNTVTAITAKQDITLSVTVNSWLNSSSYLEIKTSNDETITASQQFNSSNYAGEGSAIVNLKAGDYIYFFNQGYNDDGGVTFTAQKVQSGNMAHIIKPAVAVLQLTKAQGTNGGVVTDDNWTTIILNEWSGETWFLSGANGTLSTGGTNTNFTLQAGQYRIRGQFASSYRTNYTRYRLVTTGGSVLIDGQTNYSSEGYNGVSMPGFEGVITITSSTACMTQLYVTHNNSNSDGCQGLAMNISGLIERYVTVTIEKLK